MKPGRVVALSAVDAAVVAEIRDLLRSGEVLGIPTDTLYGLAADPFSPAGVERILELKGRPRQRALPVLVASVEELRALGVVAPADVLDRLRSIWPAPLTAVLPVERAFPATGGERTVAVRVPAHPELLALLSSVGPLTATSANLSGEKPARTAGEVADVFRGRLGLILDGGPSASALPSTLVDLSKTPCEILRSGAYRWL